MDLLKRLRARLAAIAEEIRGIDAAVEARGALTLNDDETARWVELSSEREQIEARIIQVEAEETRRAADAAAAVDTGSTVSGVTVGAEPTVYGRGSGQSYFLDLARAKRNGEASDGDALRRLLRHGQELDVDLPVRAARGVTNPFEKRVNPNRTDGQGGYFVPPLWLIDEYVPYLRAGRTAANLVHNMPLPAGTDSINLPTVATGTTTAAQQDAGAVSSTDLTDATVSAPVRTIAGQQDVAMQLLDQSPISFDDVVMKDLLSSYNSVLDTALLRGAGTSGTIKGIANISGINAVTYTDASPTVPELYPFLGQALSQIAKARFQPGTGILMHPSAWYWVAAALDTTNRPLVPMAGGAYNPVATGEVNGEGAAGQAYGVPIFTDANIATNLGAGTNQSTIYVCKWDDLYLWEGELRSRVLFEVLSGTLQVRIQLYNYAAFMADRYPKSISAIDGTGLIVQSGF